MNHKIFQVSIPEDSFTTKQNFRLEKLDLKQLLSPIYVGFGLKYLNGIFSFTEEYDGEIITKEDSVSIFSDLEVVYRSKSFSFWFWY